MAEETEQQVEQQATQAPTEAPAEQPEGTTQPPAEAGAEEASPPSTQEPAPWARKRIDDLTREKHEAKRRADELEARVREMEAAQTAGRHATDDAEIDRLARERATQIAAEQRFNDACNRVYESGKTEFQDFDQKLATLTQNLGNLNITTLSALVEVDNPHKVLYHLGTDLNEAARILSLPPLKQAMELAKIGNNMSNTPTKPASKAPAPITPKVGVGGGAQPDIYSDKLSTSEWMELRNKQLKEKRASH